MVEVLCQYRSINGTMGVDFLGLAVTSREIREMIWQDAKRNYGKGVALFRVSGENKWEIIDDKGVVVSNEWYTTREVSNG